LLLFQTSQHATKFSVLEDRQAWYDGQITRGSFKIEDITHLRGRLVVFDSVQLSHEVREIKSGTRRALEKMKITQLHYQDMQKIKIKITINKAILHFLI
jgi:hypothetical protein